MSYLLLVATLVAAALGLIRPWVGVISAYLFVILTPQAIWFWAFAGTRPVYWILATTTLGVAWSLLAGQLGVASLENRRNFYLLVLWGCFVLSYYTGPFVHYHGQVAGTDPAWYLSQVNKVFFLFLIASLCLDEPKKLKMLFYVTVFSAIYLIYWANDQYLSGRVMGRLSGPTDVEGNGIYSDENSFAMLFVVAQPFLWYFGASLKARALRWSVWMVIPFGWHAVFLTASRGGLIGVGVTTVLIALKSRHRLLALLLIPAFWGAYQWQAGQLMKSRAETIGDTTENSSAARIEAWNAASRMIADHPFTGVGLASFVRAYEQYSDKRPREAHNTVLQVAAESGVLAGLMYAAVAFSSIAALWRNRRRWRGDAARGPDEFLYLMNEATLVALCGFCACAMFLSLQLFELFYCLVLMTNAVLFLSAAGQPAEDQSHPVDALPPPLPQRTVPTAWARFLPDRRWT